MKIGDRVHPTNQKWRSAVVIELPEDMPPHMNHLYRVKFDRLGRTALFKEDELEMES